ncbi:MAG: ribonuclease III [Victivallaceae bacterium]|nr:ribonuclease III [Victivallaceae bacterium]
MAEAPQKLKTALGIASLPLEGALLEAFTHRTYAVEHNLDFDNQRLEFLGDAVLEIILSEQLFRFYPEADEGKMTKMRSALVRESTIARFARELDLGSALMIGHGEQDAAGGCRESIVADLFEAVLGALYLQLGIDPVRKLVTGMVERDFPEPIKLLNVINPKGMLQEFVQRGGGGTPVYRVLRQSGPDHNPVFEVEVNFREYTACGRASSRKNAESAAACKLYEYLTGHGHAAKPAAGEVGK